MLQDNEHQMMTSMTLVIFSLAAYGPYFVVFFASQISTRTEQGIAFELSFGVKPILVYPHKGVPLP